jgi:hypothetical protein
MPHYSALHPQVVEATVSLLGEYAMTNLCLSSSDSNVAEATEGAAFAGSYHFRARRSGEIL